MSSGRTAMSASLLILVPAGLLVIMALLCFAGCTFSPLEAWTKYTDNTVLAIPAVVAYWPLGEASDSDPAVDRVAGHKGSYIDPATAPSLYPWPAYSVPSGSGPDIQSADAPGQIFFGLTGIVQGD